MLVVICKASYNVIIRTFLPYVLIGDFAAGEKLYTRTVEDAGPYNA